MSEEKALTKPKPAPVGWGDRDEVKEIADRLRLFVPGTKKMNDQEVLAYAQLVQQTGLNPCRNELYAWDSNGDGTGDLVTQLYYGILVRWAQDQEPFNAHFTTTLDPDTEDITSQCQLVRQSDRKLLAELLTYGVEYREAIGLCASIGTGIITKAERWSRKYNKEITPPKGKSWPWKAEKRALVDAVRRAYGEPSTEELARQAWVVGDTLTIPSDWKMVTPEMSIPEREALALAEARTRTRKPSGRSFEQDMADLGFGEPTEEPPEEILSETPPEPESAVEAEESAPEPPETAQEGMKAVGDMAPAEPIIRGYKLKLQRDAQVARERGATGNPSPEQRGLMNGMVKKIVGDEFRKLVLAWIFDYDTAGFSTDILDAAEVKIILDELKPEKVDGRNYEPTRGFQVFKWLLHQAQIDFGQIEMFAKTEADDIPF